MDRIDKLCAYLNPCETFADIGCDHGYCTLYVLKNNLAKHAYIADISEKCLKKAENLLRDYIEKGRVTPVCCDGLQGIPDCDEALIAGMGGEEIISILKRAYIPENFVFQPMKNVADLRRYLLDCGAEITRDEVFESGGKYYFVLCGKREGKSVYTEAQLEYGKGDINGALGGYLREEIAKKRQYLERGLSRDSRLEIERQIKQMAAVLKGEINRAIGPS